MIDNLSVGAFYRKWLDKWDTPDHGAQWRREESDILEAALKAEQKCAEIAAALLERE
ncbi:MAG: hypothetical protein LBH17_00445 [Oscillospiraceae bacterium]|jgi:hypothetical protein|nr:hypothetical protein [Oscillospiraceae bacterium]